MAELFRLVNYYNLPRHGIDGPFILEAMAPIEIDGLPNLKMVDLSMAKC